MEQVGGFLFYSVLIPFWLHHEGVDRFGHDVGYIGHSVQTLSLVMLVQVVLSLVIVYFIDRSNRDIFRIQTAKSEFRKKFPWMQDEDESSLLRKFRAFIIFVWKFTPPMVLLLWREGGVKGHPVSELWIVFASIIVATLYSVAVLVCFSQLGWWVLGLVVCLALWPAVKSLMVKMMAS